MAETWKPIEGFEGYYEISTAGRIRSLCRTVWYAWSGAKSGRGRRSVPAKMMKQMDLPNGYMRIILQRDGTELGALTHRLVAQTFIPNPDGKPTVNHIDGCKRNNKVENLEWATVMGKF